MDFGVLDCLMSLENNPNNLISWGDSDRRTKWVGSAVGFCTQESSVSAIVAGAHEDAISNTMLLQHHRSDGDQNMLSFSLPNAQNTLKLPYYARGYEDGGLFTPSQRMELEHQALIYKYITANASIPSNLLMPIRKSIQTIDYSTGIYKQNTCGWGGLHLGLCNLPGSNPEPGRCRRTDGKKWRCAKDAVPDQKYCERHINRGRHRSRKLVEAQNGHSIRTNATKLTSGSTILCHTIPVSSSSSVPLKHSRVSNSEEHSMINEFGFLGSDSLINPMQKSDAKSHLFNTFVHSSQPAIELSSFGMGTGKRASRVPGGPLGEVLQPTSNSVRDHNQ